MGAMTRTVPKPMVRIGYWPILWHIMKRYAAYGLTEFIIAGGYLADVIAEWAEGLNEYWDVRVYDTGLDAQTGGRLLSLRHELQETFCLTYGDGVADINVQALLDYHRSHTRLVTLTAVYPPARFGRIDIADDGTVIEFREKARLPVWVNGGYFVVEPRALDYIHGDVPWEFGPLEALAMNGELRAYRHKGFWKCMDTPRDWRELNELYSKGKVAWLR